MTRRLKSEVCKQLPDKRRRRVPLHGTGKLMKEIASKSEDLMEDEVAGNFFYKIAQAKLPAVKDRCIFGVALCEFGIEIRPEQLHENFRVNSTEVSQVNEAFAQLCSVLHAPTWMERLAKFGSIEMFDAVSNVSLQLAGIHFRAAGSGG